MSGDVVDPPVVAASWELFSERHDRLRARVRDWITERIVPHVDDWERAQAFPRELFADAGRQGLFGWKVSEEYGGQGPDFLADVVVAQELARAGSGGVAAALGAHKDLGPYYLWRFGTPEQRRRWVTPAVAGQIVGALAVTEPGAGTDVASIRTRARRAAGGDWVLDGAKTFITNGSWADVIVVAAVTDPDAGGHRGQTLFAVEATDPGFEARRLATLGWRTSHTAELTFDDLRLPADRVVGGPDMVNQGFVCIMRNFQWERIAMATAAVVASERLLDEAVTALRARDRLIGSWRERLAALVAEVASVRALSDHAIRLFVSGQDAVREVSMAKWRACALSVQVADEAMQAHGAAGVTAAPRVQRALRDARLGPIGGGTTEIMLEVVGRSYGL